ncbi:MAG: helix-turn-helix domain-containing protein [Bacteroidaceae bacterium]|nr:helix-turn-helix domain-containing protein [Bacteroidaceae bacterium]
MEKKKYINKNWNSFTRFIVCLCVLAVVASCVGDGEHDGSDEDFSHILDSVAEYTSKDSLKTLRYIHAAEKSGKVSWDTIHLAKANMYYITYNFACQEKELQLIVDSSTSSKTSDFYLYVLQRLARSQAVRKKTKSSIKTSLYGDSLAYLADNKFARAQFRFTMGMSAMQNDNDRGIKYMRESLTMFEEINDSASRVNLIRNTMYLMNTYIIKGDYASCIGVGEKVADDIRMSDSKEYDIMDPNKSIRFGIFGLLCLAYANQEQLEDAGIAYAYAMKYDNDSPTTPLLMTTCLMRMGREEEAIEKFKALQKQYIETGDTADYYYINVLEGLKSCSDSLGRKKESLAYAKDIINARKAVYLKSNKDNYTEWDTKYRTQSKEMELKDTIAQSKVSRIISISMCIALIAVIVVLSISLRYSRIMNRKNQFLVIKANEILELRKSIGDYDEGTDRMDGGMMPDLKVVEPHIKTLQDMSTPSQNVTLVAEKEEVGEKARLDIRTFIHELKTRKLYKDPNFRRDDLLAELGISKRTFSHDFELVTGKSVLKYVSILRVESAAQSIRKYPNYTIEGIAMDSGFASRASFYRQFSDYFGISPTEYRVQLNAIDADDKVS